MRRWLLLPAGLLLLGIAAPKHLHRASPNSHCHVCCLSKTSHAAAVPPMPTAAVARPTSSIFMPADDARPVASAVFHQSRAPPAS